MLVKQKKTLLIPIDTTTFVSLSIIHNIESIKGKYVPYYVC